MSSLKIRSCVPPDRHHIWDGYSDLYGSPDSDRMVAAPSARLGCRGGDCCRDLAPLARAALVRRKPESAAWLARHSAIRTLDQPALLRATCRDLWTDLQDEPFLPPDGLHHESRIGPGLVKGT